MKLQEEQEKDMRIPILTIKLQLIKKGGDYQTQSSANQKSRIKINIHFDELGYRSLENDRCFRALSFPGAINAFYCIFIF